MIGFQDCITCGKGMTIKPNSGITNECNECLVAATYADPKYQPAPYETIDEEDNSVEKFQKEEVKTVELKHNCYMGGHIFISSGIPGGMAYCKHCDIDFNNNLSGKWEK